MERVAEGGRGEELIAEMARDLARVPGVVGVMLGGSRARGEAQADSDWDLGVYYRGEPDLTALRALAGEDVDVAAPGGWGPWVNGGAWLRVNGVAVDWILRDLDRVRGVWHDCRAGRFEVGVQAGHPLGFWSPCYVGEVVLGRPLADAGGELAQLRAEAGRYPEPLRRALVDAAWEAEFLVAGATKSAGRGDVLHVSLCLARAVGVLVQALHGDARRWCLNEKGSLATAAKLPGAPRGFTERVEALLGGVGERPEQLTRSVDTARELVAEARALMRER